MNFERSKGEWKTTIPKRIAEFFLQNEQPVSLEDLFVIIYPDELVTRQGIGKLYGRMGVARKILRKQGAFIADPRKHGGKYVLEKDPSGILKQAKTGEVRATNGVEIMETGEQVLLNDEVTHAYGISLAKSLSRFIMKLTESYIQRRLPSANRVDNVCAGDNNPAPSKLLNPPSQ